MRFSVECAFSHLRKRRPASRKSAFCTHRLTERRILYPPRSQSAPFREDSQPECVFLLGSGGLSHIQSGNNRQFRSADLGQCAGN